MPRTALTLVALWFVGLFVARSIQQWRRTGSTGWRGITGKPGSIEWTSGVVTALGFAATVASPLATLFEWPGGAVVFRQSIVHGVGGVLAVLGTIGALAAQTDMGDSWRVGVDETEETQLVTDGLFGWVRNPIFSFMILSLVGLLLLLPSPLSFLATTLCATGIELQVRFVEEPYLRARHGRAYDDYCTRTGRFVPGIGRGA